MKKVIAAAKKYLGVWAWVSPLNWTDPQAADWAPGWIANYVVIVEALVLAGVGLSKVL